MAARICPRILFITGTDTGVGKTVFTALLLHHLRMKGIRALAMKPFCSGGRGDVRLLQSLQRGELADKEMNPYYFAEPVAPAVAAEKHGIRVDLISVVKKIEKVKERCDWLLVEGAGGLLVPLNAKKTIADLIDSLDCSAVVVARNKLGTINHTLLTISKLRELKREAKAVVLMAQNANENRANTMNSAMIQRFLPDVGLFSIPALGKPASTKKYLLENHKKVENVLDQFGNWMGLDG